jgi:hypothetical protein
LQDATLVPEEEMTLPTSPEPKDLLNEWAVNPEQEVWVVDETKTELLPEQKSHGELIAFSIIRTLARDVTQLLTDAAQARTRLRGQQATASFKSGKLYKAYEAAINGNSTKEPLATFAGVIAKFLGQRSHIMQLLTTHLHVRESPEFKLTAVSTSGAVSTITSKQLNVVNNGVRRLMLSEWKPVRGPVDIVIDRAQALGLDPAQQGIQPHQFNMFRGKLAPTDPFEVRIIAGSDTESTLRDLLLLPDFFGYLTRMHQQAGHSPNLDVGIGKVLSGETPFLLTPYDVPAMIAAAKEQKSDA